MNSDTDSNSLDERRISGVEFVSYAPGNLIPGVFLITWNTCWRSYTISEQEERDMTEAVRKTQTGSNSGQRFSARYVAFVGVFGAIAAVLMYLEFPLPFAPAFYKLDFSEVPVLIGTFSLGPLAGVLIEFIKILLHFIIKGTQTAGVGEIANFAVGCAMILPAGIIYRLHKTKKNALIGMAAGTLVMAFAGAFFNAFVVLPAYAKAFQMPIEALVEMGTKVNPSITSLFTFVLLAVVPFNLVKGVLVSFVTWLLYKRVSGFIHRAAG